ncbi:MAG: DUF5131 family protein, partial [bacterium]|nr:DUF5131 family protein [bacterium]
TLDFLGQQKQHRFYLLTKQSLRLTMLYFPSNIWLGVTINIVSEIKRVMDLKVTDAKIKFISFEPLYEAIPEIDLSEIDWIIIGGETMQGKTSFVPEKVWVHNLIGDA